MATIIEAAKTISSGWEPVVKDALPELTHISKLLDTQKKLGTYFPYPDTMFNSFKLCPYQDIKVVIVGYQPQYGTIQTEAGFVCRDSGLAYSIRSEDAMSKSLQNIYIELKNSVKDFVVPSHGNLEAWAKQGILMINNSLTVAQQKNVDVSELWYGFLNKVFKWIKKVNPNVIYVLWGRKVSQISKLIPDGAIILESLCDPSGYRVQEEFLNCNHFNIINEHLKKQNKQLIDWSL